MPAPTDNYTYADIANESIDIENVNILHSLNLDDYDPLFDEVHFSVPYYEKAIEWYLKYYPQYSHWKVEDKARLIKEAYNWMHKGYLHEIKSYAVSLVRDKNEKSNFLIHEKDKLNASVDSCNNFTDTIKRLSTLPERIQYNHPTDIETYKQACQGAVKIVTEGLITLDECLRKMQSVAMLTHNTTKSVNKKKASPKKKTTIDKNDENLTYFREQVRDKINKAIRSESEPNKKDILKHAMSSTVERKKVSIEKLRKDISPAIREDAYGKIYREELEHKKFSISKLNSLSGIK